MNRAHHARILRAYLARIPSAQLVAIAQADADLAHANMQLGTLSQLEANDRFMAACQAAVDHMLDYDLAAVTEVIQHATQEGR